MERKKEILDLQDSQLAQICCILANVHRDAKEYPEPFPLEDFKMFNRQSQSEDDQESWKLLYAGMKSYTATYDNRNQVVRKPS